MKTYGPYLRKDNRLMLVIVDNGKMTSVSYPKYLMETFLGRKLLPDETVDHIDNDPLNNDLSNLRIVTRAENARRAVKPAELTELVCKTCGVKFFRRLAVHKRNVEVRKVDGPFCSHKCVGKVHH